MFLTDTNDVHLAIVIPVWRARFLGEALDSLRAQTDQRFRVYVCDDSSSDDIPAVVEKHGVGLEIVYHRFSVNLGGRDLVKHWERCLERTVVEPWLWLFADDDEVLPETVESFYQMRKRREDVKLYCLSVDIIDDAGELKRSALSPPDEETAQALLSAVLTFQGREMRCADHIFSRSLYQDCGGFVWTPQAINSDTATWIWFTENSGGKVKLPRGGLRWREHAASISQGNWAGSRRVFLAAFLHFYGWVDHFIERYPTAIKRRLSRDMFNFFYTCYQDLPGEISSGETGEVMRQVLGFKNSGGHLRAAQIWLNSKRRTVRGWPIISIWCRWRYQRRTNYDIG